MEIKNRKKMIKLMQVVIVGLSVFLIFKYMLPVVLPFVFAYGICRCLYPVAEGVRKKIKLPIGIIGTIIVSISSILIFALLFLFGKYLFGQLMQFILNIDSMFLFLNELFERLCSTIGWIFKCDGAAVSEWFAAWSGKIQDNFHVKLMEVLAKAGITLIRGAAVLLVIIMISLVAAVLLIKNKKQIERQIRRSEFSKEVLEISGKICEVIACFFRSQVIIIAVVAVVCSAGLFIMQNSYAILIGLFIAIMDALPVIGSGTIFVPWIIIEFLAGSSMKALALVFIYILCAFTREFLEARLMGNSLGINEFYVLMATFAGVYFFGFWGIILGPVGIILIIEILKQLRYRQDT